MSNHLFPVKLASFMNALVSEGVLKKQEALFISSPNSLKYPDDGKIRIPLISSEIHSAVKSIEDLDDYFDTKNPKNDVNSLRKRLSFIDYNSGDFSFINICENTAFEMYDFDGNLVFAQKVTGLRGYLAAALEVELLVMLLESSGQKITMM